jgi:probable O-glycosylation ligase (exosortase A-associated)
MRDVVVFTLFVVLLPMCFFRPWFGLMAFTWLAYNRTQDLTWGFARTLPISQIVAVAMILGWMVWEFRPLVRRDVRLWAMIVLVAIVAGSIAANTLRWDYQGSRFSDLVKIVFVALLTSALCVTRRRLRAVMFVVAIGLGFYGVKNAFWFMLGQGTGVGPGGMLKDNNDFALAMVMNLPLLWYLADDIAPGRWQRLGRRAMHFAFFLTMLTVMATGSRGGFLSMGIVLMMMAMKTRWKVPALIGMALLALIGLMLAPPEYIERLQSITKADDESVQGRFLSWQVAFNMIQDRPMLGIGFKNMVWEYQRYLAGVKVPMNVEVVPSRVAHNSYLQVWAESGSFAFAIFLFMIFSTIFMARRIVKRTKGTVDAWIAPYGLAIECSFYGFLTGAMFLNRAHFDLLYQLVAVCAALPAVLVAERVRQARLAESRRRGRGPAREITIDGRSPLARAGG